MNVTRWLEEESTYYYSTRSRARNDGASSSNWDNSDDAVDDNTKLGYGVLRVVIGPLETI